MCGLVGVLSFGTDNADARVFQTLLHLDVVRGYDSTGIAVINKEDTQIMKAVGQPHKLYDQYRENGITKNDLVDVKKDTQCIIGHNRWATQGNISEEFAHPFDMGNIIGTHNGTVNINSLEKLTECNGQNDSQMIFKYINDSDENVQNLWDTAEGAMALVWWNKEKQALNFLRNEEREFHYYLDETSRVLYWASEKWMLYVALNKARVIMRGDVVESKPHTHYKFCFNLEKNKFFPPIIMTKEEVKKKVVTFHKVVPEYQSNVTGSGKSVTFSLYFYEDFDVKKEGEEEYTICTFTGYDDFGEEVQLNINMKKKEDRVFIEYLKAAIDNKDYTDLFASKFVPINRGPDRRYLLVNLKDCCFNTKEVKKDNEVSFILSPNGIKMSRKDFEKVTNNTCASCHHKLDWEERDNFGWFSPHEALCESCNNFYEKMEA